MKVRKYCVFHGRVQGVGFRYTLYQQARRFGLTGWVHNQYDGSVDACLQGEDFLVEQVLESMKQQRFISIDHIEMKDLDVLSQENSFEIKY